MLTRSFDVKSGRRWKYWISRQITRELRLGCWSKRDRRLRKKCGRIRLDDLRDWKDWNKWSWKERGWPLARWREFNEGLKRKTEKKEKKGIKCLKRFSIACCWEKY